MIRLPEIKTAELSTYDGNFAKYHQPGSGPEAHFRVSRVGLGTRLTCMWDGMGWDGGTNGVVCPMQAVPSHPNRTLHTCMWDGMGQLDQGLCMKGMAWDMSWAVPSFILQVK